MNKIIGRGVIAAVVGLGGLSWNGDLRLNPHSAFVSSAQARIGRPLTPLSYAGVARRTTRRAVAVGAATAPVVVVPGVVCTQVVNAYGQIVRVCR